MTTQTTSTPSGPVMAVHGGAGVIKKEQMPPGAEEAYLEKLREALAKGYGILKAGGPCLDAVETTIRVLEDFPLFNAGKGSAFTHDGRNQMDAAIMNGADLRAGAVAGVSRVRNPIRAARAVMERSHHVMLTGEGAESFAGQAGLAMEEPSYFYTEARWRQLQDALAAERSGDPGALRLGGSPTEEKFGTVGCVALDVGGNLAAGTSTGGMVNKSFNRVGDSPIIGAGTYANNRTCAVSCTGWGEFFIRTLAAKTVSDLMEYKGISLREATDLVIFSIIPELGGDGGMIAVDRAGQVAMPFNTPGMFRGQVDGRGEVTVEMYGS